MGGIKDVEQKEELEIVKFDLQKEEESELENPTTKNDLMLAVKKVRKYVDEKVEYEKSKGLISKDDLLLAVKKIRECVNEKLTYELIRQQDQINQLEKTIYQLIEEIKILKQDPIKVDIHVPQLAAPDITVNTPRRKVKKHITYNGEGQPVDIVEEEITEDDNELI